jgi:hypothetical protein
MDEVMAPVSAPVATATAPAAKSVTNKSLLKKKLNLELAPAAFALLEQLSEETDKTKVEILRTGLALYGIAHDASKRDQGIGIIDGDKVVKEILIP